MSLIVSYEFANRRVAAQLTERRPIVVFQVKLSNWSVGSKKSSIKKLGSELSDHKERLEPLIRWPIHCANTRMRVSGPIKKGSELSGLLATFD